MKSIEEQLKEKQQIAAIWSVDDVLTIRHDLSTDQAWEVLQTVKKRESADLGINWEIIEEIANELYPEPHIITTVHGVEINMTAVSGPKGKMVLVFRDSDGGYHAVSISSIVDGGIPIESDGPNDGDDMEFVDVGFE